MPLKMHRYNDGLTGLAFFCDVCDQQITSNGYVVWRHDPATDQPAEWHVIHQGRCDDGRPRFPSSMPIDVELIYLANSAGIDLDAARQRALLLDSIC